MLILNDNEVTDDVLRLVAHLPTRSLNANINPNFFQKLTDSHFMRIAVLLAEKSYNEGGCPIGGVVVDNQSALHQALPERIQARRAQS